MMPNTFLNKRLSKYGGVPAWGDVNAVALERAIHVLESFDLVLLAETMTSDPDQLEMVAGVLDVPENVTSLASHAKNVVEKGRDSRSALLEGIKLEIPHTYELLRRRCKFERELYEHAVRINQRLLVQWRMEKSSFKERAEVR